MSSELQCNVEMTQTPERVANVRKVAFFMPSLHAGGAERTTIELANQAVERGHQVAMVTGQDTGALAHELDQRVERVGLNTQRVLTSLWPLVNWLRVWRPDVLVASQTHANIMAAMAKKLSRSKCKLILREESSPSINLKSMSYGARCAIKPLMRWAYVEANQIVAVSKGAAEDTRVYLKASFPNLTTIYNPVIHENLFERSKESLNHPWFSKPSEVPVILAVGRLTAAKNYPLLIRAFFQIRKQQQVRLLILGEGEERQKIEQLVKHLGLQNDVQLPGFDPNPYRYMSNCTVYVMSSSWEGLGSALIEGLALAPKVVAVDCPSGPAEILDHGQFGLLTPLDDAQALANAIIQQLDGKGPHVNEGDLQAHLRQFSAAVIEQKFMQVIES